MPLFQKVTFFADDDTTELASISTDPAHANPYLVPIESRGEQSVNFIEGAASIGQIRFRVLDKRRTAIDQQSGWFTYLISAGGKHALVGRRVTAAQQTEVGGAYEQFFNGVIEETPKLTGRDMVFYEVSCRDIRERERQTEAFINATGRTILPWGLTEGYGLSDGGTYLIPPEAPITGVFRKTAHPYLTPFPTAGRVTFDKTAADWGVDEARMDLLHRLGRYIEMPDTQLFTLDILGTQLTAKAAKRITVKWRAKGSSDAWTVLTDMPWETTTFNNLLGGVYGVSADVFGNGAQNPFPFGMFLSGPNLPAEGQAIELFVLPTDLPPSSEVPLYIERNAGELLKGLYDGEFSYGYGTLHDETRPIVSYDTDAMDAMIAETPLLRAKITEIVGDLREWAEENIYKPLGYAPIIDPATGNVAPRKYDLPDATMDFIELNDTNVHEDASWSFSKSGAVNNVSFEYIREFIAPQEGTVKKTALDRLVENKVTVEFSKVDSIALLGNQDVKYAPVTVRSISSDKYGAVTDGQFHSELGNRLAQSRISQLTDRYGFGDQRVRCKALRSDSDVAGAKAGDWLLAGMSWLPDLAWATLGMDRIMQITRVKEVDAVWREFELSDAGPNVAPVGQPTVGVIAADGLFIDVPITAVPADVTARVEFAVNATLPSVRSGLWQYGGSLTAAATVRIGPFSAGQTVWVRVRGEAQGRIRSTWTAAQSLVLANPIDVHSVSLDFSGTTPIVYWTASSSTMGVRIRYRVHAENTSWDGLFDGYVDADASLGVKQLTGVVVAAGRQITVVVDAYPGWTGAAVSGTVGVRSQPVSLAPFEGEDETLPLVGVSTSETSTTGTLTLEVNDPQSRITKVEFNTQSGTDAWSGWVEDTAAPYAASVTLVAEKHSKIAYRVTGYDLAGNVSVLAQDEVSFLEGIRPNLPNITASFTEYGDLRINLEADSDTSTFKVAVSTAGQPSDATVRAQSAVVASGGKATVSVLGPFALGETVYIGAFAYGVGGTPESPRASIVLHREGAGLVHVQEQPSETDTVGTLTLVVTDPRGRVTEVAFRTQIGNSNNWSAWTADTSVPYAASVSLVEKQVSRIAYRVTGVDDSGTSRVLREDVVPFTAGRKPAVPIIDVSFLQNGGLNIAITGDSDSVSHKYFYSTGGMPTDNDARTGYTGAARVFRTTTGDAIGIGSVVYIKAFAYSAAGTESDAGTLIVTREGWVAPEARETATETASTGTLTLTLVDPQSRVSAVHFATAAGNGGWTAFSDDAGTRARSVSLIEKQVSRIAYRVYGTNATGAASQLLIEGVVPFTAGQKPMVPVIDLSFNETGGLNISLIGDSDTTSFRYTYSTTSMPSDAAARAGAGPLGRTYTATSGDTIQVGASVYFKAFAYSVTGVESEVGTLIVTREGYVPPDIQEVATETNTIGTLTLTAHDPQSRIQEVQFNVNNGSGWAGWYIDAAPYAASVNLYEKQVSRIAYRVFGLSPQGGSLTLLKQGVVPFSMGKVPIPPAVAAHVRNDGSVLIEAFGDSDTAGLRIAYSTSTWADPSSWTYQAGRLAGILTSAGLAPGTVLYCTAIAYNASGEASGIGYLQYAVPAAAQLTGVRMTVLDDGTNDTYTVLWNTQSMPSGWTVRAVLYKDNVRITESSSVPATDGTVVTVVAGGDGISNRHHAVVLLSDAAGVVQSVTTRPMLSQL